ncbi:Uma2 family endonuclease [Rubinisphaera margarita]|uniref:Uma2 family endonuclease n=1 Tax=Rubinisphaera margarita TaxID=2909586 RepID=UPI001EE80AEF|nr:Uma2 family endonuclease [Rubinisphaera margarita]MCG6155056.1 Uma2 family endonuclease [Rubinisphaera margarita]
MSTIEQHDLARQRLFLENGDCLERDEFLRRWDNTPDLKHAELIDGVVYTNAASRVEEHGIPSNWIHGWLWTYTAATPGVSSASETTVELNAANIVQPDGCLYLRPECGGATRVNRQGLLAGPPELVVEIAASSASRDLNQKKAAYEQAGVKEYVVWNVSARELKWFQLESDRFTEQSSGDDGVYRSRQFPGLWLSSRHLLTGDMSGFRDVLLDGLSQPDHKEFVARLGYSPDK